MVEPGDDPRARTLVLEAGTLLLAVTVLAFGIEHVVFSGDAGAGMYPWVLGSRAWNCAFGAFLVATSLGVGIRRSAPLAGRVLGTTLFLYALVLYVPRIVAQLRDSRPQTGLVGVGSPLAAASELLAMGGAAWVLSGGRMATPGRLLFAGTMLVFGLQHFLYAGFLATLIPSWIPGHPFWEVFVGAAFLAAAAAIAADRAARLAAFSLGTMFLLFVLVLHAPRVVAAVRSADEWTSACVAVAMSGGAFVLAGAARRSTAGDPGR